MFFCALTIIMSGYEKTTYLGQFINFDLVKTCLSKVVELFIALCCTSIAASVTVIHLK